MALNAKNLNEEEFFFGHKACPGCGGSLALRIALKVLGERSVAVIPAGCMSAVSFNFPQLCFSNNAIISTFAGTASMLTGIEAGLRAQGITDFQAVGLAGDGGTADIGIQALSGAIDRNDNILYICYDNEAYMNTGTQRSSATPRFASATTTPAGVESVGKKQNQKDLTQIVVAHGSPYVAQTTFLGNFKDFHEKAHKAIYTEGPTFVNVLCPCPRGWQYSAELLPEICRLAVDTCIWPLYEVENGEYHLTYMPKKKLPVEEFMKLQGRFRHCFKPGNEWTIEAAQNYVDEKWEALLAKCK